MTMYVMSSGEGFEDYCLRTFKTMLHGEMFPYSLRETYHLVFDSWDEAVKEINEYGVEGYSYMESPDADDYLLSMCGFTRHVVMQDKSLQLLALFCDTTYRQQMTIFDIPVRFTTRCEKMANGTATMDSCPAVVICMPRPALTNSCRSRDLHRAQQLSPHPMVFRKKGCCVS